MGPGQCATCSWSAWQRRRVRRRSSRRAIWPLPATGRVQGRRQGHLAGSQSQPQRPLRQPLRAPCVRTRRLCRHCSLSGQAGFMSRSSKVPAGPAQPLLGCPRNTSSLLICNCASPEALPLGKL